MTRWSKNRTSKYNAVKTVQGGKVYASKHEAQRAAELKLLERAGEIYDLREQVPFELIPAQRDERGKLLERKCRYVADFVYYDKDGQFVVEDAKGSRTKEYIIKRKLMLKVHGIRLKEV